LLIMNAACRQDRLIETINLFHMDTSIHGVSNELTKK
jgi:hypothetical protein